MTKLFEDRHPLSLTNRTQVHCTPENMAHYLILAAVWMGSPSWATKSFHPLRSKVVFYLLCWVSTKV